MRLSAKPCQVQKLGCAPVQILPNQQKSGLVRQHYSAKTSQSQVNNLDPKLQQAKQVQKFGPTTPAPTNTHSLGRRFLVLQRQYYSANPCELSSKYF